MSKQPKVTIIKLQYPPGTRLELIEMNDPHAPVPAGTRGTVELVDDMGTIHMKWDNGRTLGLVPGEDQFRKLSQQEIAKENKASDVEQSAKSTCKKPSCPLIEQDGNIFNLMGIASRTLREHGMAEEAKEMYQRITQSESYGAALNIIGEYVNITSVDDMDEDWDNSMHMKSVAQLDNQTVNGRCASLIQGSAPAFSFLQGISHPRDDAPGSFPDRSRSGTAHG